MDYPIHNAWVSVLLHIIWAAMIIGCGLVFVTGVALAEELWRSRNSNIDNYIKWLTGTEQKSCKVCHCVAIPDDNLCPEHKYPDPTTATDPFESESGTDEQNPWTTTTGK